MTHLFCSLDLDDLSNWDVIGDCERDEKENIESTPCIPTLSGLDSNSHQACAWLRLNQRGTSGNIKMTYVYRDFCWGLG